MTPQLSCDGDTESLRAGEDIALARRAAHDPEAMAQVVRRTSPAVWRACAALVDPASADDLTQETYLRAVRSLASYRGESAPVTWLLTIARRVCADEIRGRQRRRDLSAKLHRQHRDRHLDPAGVIEVCDAIERLSTDRREAFLLTAVAGLSYAEAATACGCPVGTIRSRVARARDDLTRSLGAEDPTATRDVNAPLPSFDVVA